MHDVYAQFLSWLIRFAVVAGAALLMIHFAIGRAGRAAETTRVATDPLLRWRVRGALSCIALAAVTALVLSQWKLDLPGWALAGIILTGGLVGLVIFGRQSPQTDEQTPRLASILERMAVRLAAGLEPEPALADASRKAGVLAPESLLGPRWLAWVRGVDGDRPVPHELLAGLDLPADTDRVAAVWSCAVAVRQRDADASLEQARRLAAEARRPWLWCVAPAVYIWLLGPAVIELSGFWQRLPASSARSLDAEAAAGSDRSPAQPTCATCPGGRTQP